MKKCSSWNKSGGAKKRSSRKKRRSVRRSSRRMRRSVRRSSRRMRRSVRRSSRRMRRSMRKMVRSPRQRARSIAQRSISRYCKRGEVLKVGYTTKRGVEVQPVCIKDRGAKGKGPKVIPTLKEGTLMGYSTKLSEAKRREILTKLMNRYDYATLVRKLNAIRTLLKRTSPMASGIIDSDMMFVQMRY